ncbi:MULTISPECIES: DUF6708 domain-containing protein [unclassified Acinetobacter]|uniref:DUF6708 domain-containing protein n=1 Tax=unclassified Acinetobacter TaxID=196816 RepID=UPI0015D1DEEE|nr:MULTISPECIES: DUF6708 domain-containing protein [unclassified Acinetobacter]
MLKNDYQCALNTIGKPFEINVRNKNFQTRIREFKLENSENIQPFAHRNIIRINSTYLELLDSWDDIRGMPTALFLPAFFVLLFGFVGTLYTLFLTIIDKEYAIAIAFCLLSIFFSYLIYNFYTMGGKTDLFGKTYYPIRLNRKNRKVYAFSPYRGKIIELDWDTLRFSEMGFHIGFEREIRASVVDEKGIVQEEIILFRYRSYINDIAENKLAFLKIYMDTDDLKTVDHEISEYFDIYNRKETAKETLERLYLAFNHEEWETNQRNNKKDLVVLFYEMLFAFPLFFLRRLGLIFSKVPIWPEYIEQECAVAENDPYDSMKNKRKLPPIQFTLVEIILLSVGCIVMMSLAGLFFYAVAYWGLHR